MSPADTARMTIGGHAVDSPDRFVVIDPATEEPIGFAPDCQPETLAGAVAAAEQAFPVWRADDDARCDALRACAAMLLSEARTIAPLLTAEQGKPLASAHLEVVAAATWLSYYADLESEPTTLRDTPDSRVEVRRRPLGVVGAITPWNWPLVLATWKIAPALRAGNTMVLKPSPFTPLSTLKMIEILNAGLPAGVLNSVSGLEPLGARLVDHPAVRKISFTGSTATGQKVASAAAHQIKRVTLELGGNDPAIVLPDAEPEAVAEAIFWSAFENSGQTCVAIKRVYVHESIHDELVELLAHLASSVPVGPGCDPGVRLGPVSNRPQLDRVVELVDDAVAAGGAAVAGGGRRPGRGYFFAPTIITGIDNGVRLVDEEQFGPALPIIKYRHTEDAIARANGTSFGLGASIWTSDPVAAVPIAEQLEAGMTWINQHAAVTPDQPFAGVKSSGLGVENGPWGLDEFTDIHVLSRTTLAAAEQQRQAIASAAQQLSTGTAGATS
ncbi:aldehyde dehydrogenase family protein [[Mycobacterium] wendilense]|uniref:Aldehyde dehydrogenase family protein n=1 Tax=[Mycobacterium] wendilense TaxID=3064284 RepID=A0ABM9MJM6_9MYCO|nr:aldehyde dehydrogenase family protein [Mycolicibacterium sp. MU0050]CAJ1586844.1 aldehyde dehydrogenase family protein [Mycolicibacterium sp. MU0050]